MAFPGLQVKVQSWSLTRKAFAIIFCADTVLSSRSTFLSPALWSWTLQAASMEHACLSGKRLGRIGGLEAKGTGAFLPDSPCQEPGSLSRPRGCRIAPLFFYAGGGNGFSAMLIQGGFNSLLGLPESSPRLYWILCLLWLSHLFPVSSLITHFFLPFTLFKNK